MMADVVAPPDASAALAAVSSFLGGQLRLTLSDARVVDALADAGVPQESDALLATALEVTDPSAARDVWHRYLEGPGGKAQWSDHARSHEGASPTRPTAKKEPRPK